MSTATTTPASIAPSPVKRLASSALDFFLLTQPRAKVPEQERVACARRLEHARQKRDTAMLLLARGSRAESFRLAREADDELATTLNELEPHLADDESWQRAKRELASATEGTPPAAPALDAEVNALHVEHLEARLGAQLVADRALSPLLRSARDTNRLRFFRCAAAALLLVLLLASASLLPRKRVRVSGVYSPSYPASNLVDGDLDTEWLSPNGELGWVELFFPARNVSAVRLLNGHNRQFLDRGSKDVVIEAYLGKTPVFRGTTTFESVKAERDWLRVDLGGVRCDRIKVDVVTVHGMGAALAEVVVE